MSAVDVLEGAPYIGAVTRTVNGAGRGIYRTVGYAKYVLLFVFVAYAVLLLLHVLEAVKRVWGKRA